MTKAIRIENADTSTDKVIVEVWARGRDGEPDALVKTVVLSYPTELGTFMVYDSQYVVVKEATGQTNE